jgi:long-subunit fatty acid transport protein
LRGSLKWEQTPTVNENRDVNFPDGPKYGINLGARYQVNCKIALDFIYGHVFVPSVHIHDVNPVTGAVATGHQNTSIDLLGGQLVWNL